MQNKNKRRQIKVKESIGIACCRINQGRPECLLICKRYTYAYNTFIHGLYPDPSAKNHSDCLRALFDQMTTDEKHDILSLNFNQIWYRVWLNMPPGQNFYRNKARFETIFLANDGEKRLRKLIAGTNNGTRIWEIPKGRKKSLKEADIICAVREFEEETGITKKQYKLYPDFRRQYRYIDSGVEYINTYFLAYTQMRIKPRVNFDLQDQVDEISDIKWMNIDQIRMIDQQRRLENLLKPIFKYLKTQQKMK